MQPVQISNTFYCFKYIFFEFSLFFSNERKFQLNVLVFSQQYRFIKKYIHRLVKLITNHNTKSTKIMPFNIHDIKNSTETKLSI